jgi:hypothetical protein
MTDEDIRNRNMKMPKYECTPALGSAASLCEEPTLLCCKRKIDIVKAEDIQTDYFNCHEDVIDRLRRRVDGVADTWRTWHLIR